MSGPGRLFFSPGPLIVVWHHVTFLVSTLPCSELSLKPVPEPVRAPISSAIDMQQRSLRGGTARSFYQVFFFFFFFFQLLPTFPERQRSNWLSTDESSTESLSHPQKTLKRHGKTGFVPLPPNKRLVLIYF